MNSLSLRRIVVGNVDFGNSPLILTDNILVSRLQVAFNNVHMSEQSWDKFISSIVKLRRGTGHVDFELAETNIGDHSVRKLYQNFPSTHVKKNVEKSLLNVHYNSVTFEISRQICRTSTSVLREDFLAYRKAYGKK